MSFAKFTQAVLLLVVWLAAIPSGRAQTYTVPYPFTGGTDGEFPGAGLIQDSAGNLYGTTSYGNPPQAGSVFKLSPSGKFKVLHSFKTGGADGARPLQVWSVTPPAIATAPLSKVAVRVQGRSSNWTREANFSVLHSFSGNADGGQPFAPLILDAAGNLYGTTDSGDACGAESLCGVVFKLDQSGKETVLHSFSSFNGTYGYGPDGGVIMDSAGNLYGTTYFGGNLNDCEGEGCGVIFKITP